MTRTTARQRRPVGPGTLLLIRPVMRYSQTRDAYVLRVGGRRYGPVLVRRQEPATPVAPEAHRRFGRAKTPVQ